MKVVIIEDEPLTAQDLAEGLTDIDNEIQIETTLTSVKEAVTYLSKGKLPDLIFSDIQLGDGLSFEIFSKTPIDVPVIFCTAYDTYALDAFKANGIDYIVKPFNRASLSEALKKFKHLKQKFANQNFLHDAMLNLLEQRLNQRKSSVLVYQNERIIPLPITDIALCYVQKKVTLIICFNGQNFIVSQPLDELELLCGSDFYRANRQYLVNRKAIQEIGHYYARKLILKLSIPHKDSVIVSKERATDFLHWLSVVS
ncbi:MAG: LytTR family DNA-binding domain-containing protein [Bacteroidota bacterium]